MSSSRYIEYFLPFQIDVSHPFSEVVNCVNLGEREHPQ